MPSQSTDFFNRNSDIKIKQDSEKGLQLRHCWCNLFPYRDILRKSEDAYELFGWLEYVHYRPKENCKYRFLCTQSSADFSDSLLMDVRNLKLILWEQITDTVDNVLLWKLST